jgi:acyl-CoA synthetase (AMP-forming)/AMP-acid ligase II
MTVQEWTTALTEFMEREDGGEEAFNDMALRLFAYQYTNNKPYQAFCRERGKTLRSVKSWRDIPAVPITGFKELTLSCTDPKQAEAVYMTSGTTNPEKRGKHYHPTLQVYDRSMILNFKKRFMQDEAKIHMGILFPTEQELPNSSLAHYLALALREFGGEDSGYLMNSEGVDIPRLFEELERAERRGEPYALLGATFSFVHVLDECQRMGHKFRLPAGSRILDTGGVKGRSREIAADAFYRQLSETFGVPPERCINMYGMTELSTQLYDEGNARIPSVKSGPHWIRTRIVNPLTGEEVPPGETGVIVHCDLANFNSVTTILTEDAGVQTEGGFLLLGRVQGAEAKGCSLAVEEFLRAAKG